jgi:hypothetical protein
MCRDLAAFFVRRGWTTAERTKSLGELDAESKRRAYDAGIRNEIVVLSDDREARRGFDALLWLVRDTRPRLAAIAGWRPLRPLATVAYRVIGRNRRILAPPGPTPIQCDCDPIPHRGYRFALTTIAALLSLAIAAGVGALLASDPKLGALVGIGVSCGGSAGIALAGRIGLGGDLGGRFVAHVFVALALASLRLLPVFPLALIPGKTPRLLATIAFGALAVRVLVRSARLRTGWLDLGHGWHAAWLTLVLLPIAGLVVLFVV